MFHLDVHDDFFGVLNFVDRANSILTREHLAFHHILHVFKFKLHLEVFNSRDVLRYIYIEALIRMVHRLKPGTFLS